MELTDKDFQCFNDEATYWIRFFGLLDWRVDYAFEDLPYGYAEYYANYPGRCAKLTLNKSPDIDVNIEHLRKSAFHEVCELLLVEIRYFSLDADIPLENREKLANNAAHGIIRRLENSVFK